MLRSSVPPSHDSVSYSQVVKWPNTLPERSLRARSTSLSELEASDFQLLVASSVTVLKSITGPRGKEAKDWKHVKFLLRRIEQGHLPSRHMNTVERYMATYAKLIEESALASLVPVSSRAMAMLIIGLWAKEEGRFSFTNPITRAKSLLMLFLLLNGEILFIRKDENVSVIPGAKQCAPLAALGLHWTKGL